MHPEATQESTSELEPLDFTSQAYVNTLNHFYRGELARMMVWRERFDATTNWAILGTGSLVAFAVSNPPMMNPSMLISLFVLGFFAFLEARRFRFYDAYRARVRLLETHFVAPILLGEAKRQHMERWREVLAEDLRHPAFKVSMLFALGRRFKRVYFALHAFVLCSWFALVALLPEVRTPGDWVHAFRAEWIPGEAVLAALLFYYAALTLLFARTGALREDAAEAGPPPQFRGFDL